MKPMGKEELTRLNIGSLLLNAKIELSKAILMLDELYDDGKAELSERQKLYNIKNELRDFIEEYRIRLEKEEENK